ncbi:MAG: CvpA family protein [Eubacterium sp.]|nr:CvpA family protein [Eubacterium sp.]
MAIDIGICVIVFVSAVCYAHIGFARTVISILQWAACIVCGIFFTDDVKKFIYDTGIGPGLENAIASGLSKNAADSKAVTSAPSMFRDWAGNAADYAAREAAENITGIVLTVASFLLIILAIKIVLFLIVHLFSKEYHDGPIAFVDSFGGLVLGIILGVLYAFIALAVLVLVLQLLPDKTAETIRSYMDASYFSGIIYDNNPLLMLVRDGLRSFRL